MAIALGAGGLLVLWSLRSGRRYLDHVFRQPRAEIRTCLRQLE